MNQTTKALIVDPIFRGSRLFYSWMAFRAFRAAGLQPRILTRVEFRSDDFPAYFDSDEAIDPVINLPKGFWYGKIADEQIRELVNAIASRTDDSAAAITHVHFSGLDEMFPALLDMLAERFAKSDARATFSFVHYDARYLLRDGDGFLKMRARIQSALKRLPGARMLLLDDRLEDALPSAFEKQVIILPDPAPLEPKTIEHIKKLPESSTLYDRDDSRLRVVALGRQSDRKGLPDIIRAARELDQACRTRIYVSGPLEATQEKFREPLLALTPDPLVWRDEYVGEEEIRLTYRDAHYVLLPYDRSFEGSSGVFAYAAAFGKPIIATDHGCVGYRIKRHGLGFVYPAGRPAALARILSALPGPDSREYSKMQTFVSQYENNHNMANFTKRLLNLINDAQKPQRAPIGENNMTSIAVARSGGNAAKAVIAPNAAGQPAAGTLQDSFERLSTAPRHLDYKQIMLFDTAVSSRNLGDQIIMESTRPLLRLIFPKCIFVNAPTHEYTGTEALKLMEKSEYSFVCGTNLLASHANDYKQWKLQGTDAFLLSGLTLLGVGWWQYQERPNAYTQFLYNRILSDTAMHSVRDGYTKKQLTAAGVTNVLNTCCPTTWWLTKRHLASIPREKQDVVVFTFTDYARNLEADNAITAELAQRYRKVYCWLQGSNDYEYAQSLQSNSIEYIAPSIEAYAEFLEVTDCDYVGTRLHAGIRALQAGRRALILAVDNRATEIANDIGLPVIARDNIDAIKRTLDRGWDLDICVPYPAINAWVRQFGHSHNFDIEPLVDQLIHKLPVEPHTPASAARPILVTISGELKRDTYMHYQVQCRDQLRGDELSFLVFRTDHALGVTIRPSNQRVPSTGFLDGLSLQCDKYGELLQITFPPDKDEITANTDMGGNDGKLFDELERYFSAAGENGAARVIVRPGVEDKMEARALLQAVAAEFLRRRRV